MRLNSQAGPQIDLFGPEAAHASRSPSPGKGRAKRTSGTCGPSFDAQVKPGNHANFDIFVQSTSFNRKLVRGTKLLYFEGARAVRGH